MLNFNGPYIRHAFLCNLCCNKLAIQTSEALSYVILMKTAPSSSHSPTIKLNLTAKIILVVKLYSNVRWSPSNSIMKCEQSDLIYQLTLFRDPSRQTAPRSILRTFHSAAFTFNLISAVYIKIPREEFEITTNIECVHVTSSNFSNPKPKSH